MARKPWDQGYSFRSQDFHEQEAEPEGEPCARGYYCANPVLTRQGDGSYAREPRPGPRAFCDADRGLILAKLAELPEGHWRLAAEAEILRRSNSTLRVPFGPSLPLHEGMDALRWGMARTLTAWHARVAAAARLSPPGGVSGDGHDALVRAVAVLTAETRVDTLLGLEPGWMTWHIPVTLRQEPEMPRDPIARPPWRLSALDWRTDGTVALGRRFAVLPPDVAEEYGDCEIVAVYPGSVKVIGERGGVQAGHDVFGLHRRSELLLGEVAARAETLDGVPCRDCEDFALERAEPPSDPARPAMYSVCASCRHMMDLDTYRSWAAWYSRWADGAELECRRCQRGDHEQCEYDRCRCGTCGRVAA